MNIVLLTLLCEWVLLVTAIAPLSLPRWRWLARFPRFGISIWLASFASVVVALSLALVLAVASVLEFWQQLQRDEDNSNFLVEFGISFLPWMVLAAFGISASLLNLRLEPAFAAVREIEQLVTSGARAQEQGWYLLPSDLRAGFVTRVEGNQAVVLTQGLVNALTPPELAAVLAHERAHIRGHHLLLKSIASFCQQLAPRLVAAKLQVAEVTRFCEYAADDAALRSGASKTALISALEKLGTPAEADRVSRLLS